MTADVIDSLVARLEEAAGKAPAGPWERKRREGKHFRLVDGPNNETIAWVGHGNNEKADAISSHIAAANPANILSLCAAFKAVKGVNEHLRDEVKTFLVLWAAQYSKIQMLGGAFHPQHFDRLKELGARMDDFRRAEVNSAKKDCSPIAEVTTPQYVKDAVRGAQVAPDEIG